MANNYSSTSIMIPLLNDRELKWCINAMKTTTIDLEDGLDPVEVENWRVDEIEDVLTNSPEDIQDKVAFTSDFSYELLRDKEMKPTDIWIHSDNANVDDIAKFMFKFLCDSRPDGSLSFMWSETCSKPRPDEFSGGGCFITSDGIQWFSVWNQINEAKNLFEKKWERTLPQPVDEWKSGEPARITQCLTQSGAAGGNTGKATCNFRVEGFSQTAEELRLLILNASKMRDVLSECAKQLSAMGATAHAAIASNVLCNLNADSWK
ncbi:MAG: hypothetical protein HQL31_04040 [Planctomycetes bacterium]|nr:hypothetical protein [Planctomycetota bacterium]